MHPSSLVFLDKEKTHSATLELISIVADRYGLGLEYVGCAEEFRKIFYKREHEASPPVLILTAESLDTLDMAETQSFIESGLLHPSILLLEVTNHCVELVNEWLKGVIRKIKSPWAVPIGWRIAEVPEIAKSLSGMWVPSAQDESMKSSAFKLQEDHPEALSLIDVHFMTGAELERGSVLTRVCGYQNIEFFLVASMTWEGASQGATYYYRPSSFIPMVPVIMFVKHVYGASVWHAPSHHANLTIDDPWLRDPYGNLSYFRLLGEMERWNFHTTIAFIPWNYDNCHARVVDLFKKHRERFSISIHGNNHDHREFYLTETDKGDSHKARPAADQRADILQSILRMNCFSRMTGIEYDRVMVFPHGIGPSIALQALRETGFLATFNLTNKPLGCEVGREEPTLCSYTTKHERLLSVVRFPAPGSSRNYAYANEPSDASYQTVRAGIAIMMFLDNPVVFYTHQHYFHRGADAFSRTAVLVNSINPEVRWSGLGTIARSLYLQRRTGESTWEIVPFSPEIRVRNEGTRKRLYLIHPLGLFDCRSPVDGSLVEENWLTVDLGPGESALLTVERRKSNTIDELFSLGSKKDTTLRVRTIRILSNIRDIYFSRSRLGRSIIDVYDKLKARLIRILPHRI